MSSYLIFGLLFLSTTVFTAPTPVASAPGPAPPLAAVQPVAPAIVAGVDPLGGLVSGVANVVGQVANGFTQFINALAGLTRSVAPIVGPALVAGENLAGAAASVAIPVALSVANSGFYGGRHGYYGGGFGFGGFPYEMFLSLIFGLLLASTIAAPQPVAAPVPAVPVSNNVVVTDPISGFFARIANMDGEFGAVFTQIVNSFACLANSVAPILGPALMAGANLASSVASVVIPAALSTINSGRFYYGNGYNYYGPGGFNGFGFPGIGFGK